MKDNLKWVLAGTGLLIFLLISAVLILSGSESETELATAANESAECIGTECDLESLTGTATTLPKTEAHDAMSDGDHMGMGDVLPGMPLGYEANLGMIRGASPTADTRYARLVGDTAFGNQGEQNYSLSDSAFLKTVSTDLNIDDYIVQDGVRYADYAQRASGGVWHSLCQFSHFAYDDPIVFPGKPGVSHLHMFFGNTEANAFSTEDTILNQGSSTCGRGELNRTSYWVPAVFNDKNEAITPDNLMVYYEAYQGEQDKIQAFPDGLKMITGEAMATEPIVREGLSVPEVRWKCGWFGSAKSGDSSAGPNGPFGNVPPECRASQYSHIEMQVKFPWCWDGENLDSDDHKSHLSFPSTNGSGWNADQCPESHPVRLPRITFRLHFKIDQVGSSSANLLLSSDITPSGEVSPNGVSNHGDWFGGWNRETMQTLVENCLVVRGENCDPEHLGDPSGKLFAKVHSSDNAFSPEQILEYCPLRDTWDERLYSLAYCNND